MKWKITLEEVKVFIVCLAIVYFLIVGIQAAHVLYVVKNTDLRGNPNQIMLEDFKVKEFGDTLTGDPVEVRGTLTSISYKQQHVRIVVKVLVNGTETVLRDRVSLLDPYDSKNIRERYFTQEYGNHAFTLEITAGEQIITKTKDIRVESLKDELMFVVAYFHFNVQYIAGHKQAQENILNNSIRPLIEFHYDNPEYKFSFEIQGYGIELIADRYPETLTQMRKMINRGQMELIVTHYSDQFFLAYPLIDFEKSIELSDDVLGDHDLMKSNVFGTQEWQWSPYLPELMDNNGYDVFIGRDQMWRHYTQIKDNYWNYEETNLFVSEWDGHEVYLALDRPSKIRDLKETPENTMYVEWLNRGDGENVNTYGSDSDFEHNPGRQRHYEEECERYKEKGYVSATLSEMIHAAKDKGFKEKKLETIPGSAQGNNVYVWIGEHRKEWERYIYINTERYKARNMLLATETILKYAKANGNKVNSEKDAINDLWRDLIQAQVTDATGWGPRQIEVDYGVDLTKNVTKECTKIYQSVLNELGLTDEQVLVDTKTKRVLTADDYSIQQGVPVAAPIEYELNQAMYNAECIQFDDSVYLLTIEFAVDDKNISLTIDSRNEEVAYTPLGTKESMKLTNFVSDNTFLPLANGFIRIDNETSLIKVCTTRHVMCHVKRNEVEFKEQDADGTIVYQFYIYVGSKSDSIDFAERVNVRPTVIIDSNQMIFDPVLYTKN